MYIIKIIILITISFCCSINNYATDSNILYIIETNNNEQPIQTDDTTVDFGIISLKKAAIRVIPNNRKIYIQTNKNKNYDYNKTYSEKNRITKEIRHIVCVYRE